VRARTPENEAERLAALYRYDILDTPPDESFDLLTSLAATLFAAPISLITLIDPERQFFKSRYGLERRETPREDAFCAHAILSSEIMVVKDAAADPRFAANPLVLGDPKIRFYAGAPLETHDGFRLGSLCVMDRQPRQDPDPAQLTALKALARQAVELLEFHRMKRQLTDARDALVVWSRELEMSEARFRAFMEHNPCLAFIIDEDCRVLYANSPCEQLWRMEPGQSIGKAPEDFLPPAMAARAREMDLALMSSDGRTTITQAMPTPGGAIRHFVLSKFTFPQASGRKALGAFAVDISERVENEEKQRASETKYRELFERNPVPSWIYRTGDLRIIDVNQAAIRQFGWPCEEFVGLCVSSIRMPGETEAVEAELRTVSASHQRTKPFRYRRKNQSEIWVELSSIDIEVDGCPARLIMANDITERVESRNRLESLVASRTAELQKSLAQWRGLVEALPQFVWLLNAEGSTDYISDTWPEYTGVPKEDLLGSGWLKTVHPEDIPRIEACEQLWAHQEPYDIEYRIRSKEGAYRWVLSRGRPVREVEGGPITQWLRTTTDIDDQKRSAERLEKAVAERTAALREACERAESGTRAKSEFLAVMSHELRTPLNGVIGMAHLMEDSPLTREQQEYLDIIQSSGQALLNLINDLLDLSKMEAGRMTLENTEFRLKTVVEECIGLVSLAAAAKGLQLSLEVRPNVPVTVIGDAGRLRQILLNLLSNAVKFTERGSVRVAVTLEAARGQVVTLRLAVRDTGIGLSAEQQATLFQAFSQADTSTTRRFGGTGLGLCIAKRLVELMGGTIGVSSQLGEGATFWLNLCLEPGKAAEPSNANENEALLNLFAGTNARILVADDNVSNQQVAVGIVRKMGLSADSVADGREALEALARIPYDLVLMDVHMPEMDGLEATIRIRQAGMLRAGSDRLPVIAMTASAMQGDRDKCFAAGMDDFISKPVMPRTLADVLEKWLPRGNGVDSGVAGNSGSSAASAPSPIFDMQALTERLMGDRQLTNRVLEGYLRDMPRQIQALSQALDTGGLEQVRNQAHKMAGASASVGGEALRSVLFGLEEAAIDRDLNAVKARFQNVGVHFDQLKEAIAKQR